MKKMLKRSLALSALMAFVITGSAMAANYIGTVTVDGNEVKVEPNGNFSVGEAGSTVDIHSEEGNALSIIISNDNGTINGKEIAITSDDGRAMQIAYGAQAYVGDKNTGKVNVTANSKKAMGIFLHEGKLELNTRELTVNTLSGSAIWVQEDGAKLDINAELVNINAASDGIMVMAEEAAQDTNPNVNIDAKVINVKVTEDNAFGIHVQNGSETTDAPSGASSITINADEINVDTPNLGLSAFSNGQMNINGNLTVNASHAIDVRGNSTVNINTDGEHSTVLNGDIVFETPNAPGDAQNSGKIINAYVNVNLNGEDSSWTGRAYQTYRQQNEDKKTYSGIETVELKKDPYHGNVTGFNLKIADGAAWNMTGDSFVNNVDLQDGGVINVWDGVETFNAGELALNDGVVNLQGTSEQSANISKLSGQAGTVTVASEKAGMKITENNSISALTVAATSDYAEELASNDMASSAQKLADQVVDETNENKSAATEAYIPETAVTGAYTAKVVDGNVVGGQEAVNSTNKAISEMANHNLMVWRLENNDMNKRLGELRDSKGEHGVWVRMTRGEGKYKAIKNQYNAYQLGYDEKLSTDKSWTVGAAFTYTDGETSFATGSGENKHKGFAVYGSKLNEDGSFIDLIAKYSRLDNEFKAVAGIGNGEYETNGYSVSAEYGKRFTKANGFWIEPQVELTYGKVGSASYVTSKGVLAQQDGMESLVGRIGFAAGKNFKRGNAYVRASYLYDFDGDTKVTYSNASAARSIEDDLGGGWFEVGIGSNINLSKATHLYVDIEKTYGGDVAVPWQWNAGLRYSF